MSISIVTTVSGTTSNSYVTTAEATEYLEQNPLFYTVWDTIADKDTWIVFSANAIDRMSFSGFRYVTTQSMEFPRDITDEYTTAGYMPQVVKDAQCEMLIYLRMHVDSITMKTHKEIQSLTIDTAVSTSYFDKDNTPNDIAIGGNIVSIENLLKTWIGGANTARLRRN